MLFANVLKDANNSTLSMMQASLENARATQEAMMRQSEMVSKMQNPWKVKWSSGPVPMPVLTFQPKDAEASREAFHMMADANLKAWEVAAGAYSSAPSWMKLPYKAPGEFWAKWFDQFQPEKYDTPAPEATSEVVDAMMPTAAEPASAAPAEDVVATAAAAEPEAAVTTTDSKPLLLKKADGEADDLTAIKGIGPKLSQTLNEIGVFHFSQMASWTPENIAWIDDKLAFKGRIQREGWVEQAQSKL